MRMRDYLLISVLPPFTASALVASLADAPMRCSFHPTALICLSCFWGGYLMCLFGDQAQIEIERSAAALVFKLGVLTLGAAPFFWGISYFGWETGSLIAGVFEILPIDRRCPVEVDPYWLEEAMKQLPTDFAP